jgi:ArsR family metal-binding transcriptional regulator
MMKSEQASKHVEKLIHRFRLELLETCIPGSDTWNAKGYLEEDISAVLPHLNAELTCADYDHNLKVLVWKDKGKKYALRPYEMSGAPVTDREEACLLMENLVDLVNNIWERRHDIEPNFDRRKRPNVLVLYKLLPGTNCRQCGYPSCMAYAANLREGSTELSHCPELSRQPFLENTQKLLHLLPASDVLS